jgi:hypothetical protein
MDTVLASDAPVQPQAALDIALRRRHREELHRQTEPEAEFAERPECISWTSGPASRAPV